MSAQAVFVETFLFSPYMSLGKELQNLNMEKTQVSESLIHFDGCI